MAHFVFDLVSPDHEFKSFASSETVKTVFFKETLHAGVVPLKAECALTSERFGQATAEVLFLVAETEK